MDKSVERYNTTQALTQYYRMQYAPFLSEDVPQLTEPFYTQIGDTLQHLPTSKKVCEVGCGLGRVLFDLTKKKSDLDSVVGVDISETFVKECQKIRDEASLISNRYSVSKLPKIEFQTMDAQHLQFVDGQFDTVICLNVIDRVPEPKKVLDELYRITSKSGYVLITDPYDWSEKFTPKDNQLSNMKDYYTEEQWEFILDQDVVFEIYLSSRKVIKYRDHLLLLKKK